MDGEAYTLILRRLAALERRLSAVFRTGKVAEMQVSPYRVRVDVGPDDDGESVLTDLLPVMVPRSAEVGDWDPLTLGERVAVLSPGGEDTSAFVLPALISMDFDAVSDQPNQVVRRFGAAGDASAEVARIEVSRGATAAASHMHLRCGRSSMRLAGGGTVTIAADRVDYKAPA